MKAAITGWALRTPLGCSTDEVMRRLYSKERAAKPNDRFNAESYPSPLAASIDKTPKPTRPSHKRVLRRIGLLAVEAAHEVMQGIDIEGERLGLFSAIGGLRVHWDDIMPALSDQRADMQDAWKRGLKNLHPFWMLQHLSNNAHALIAEDLSARGEGITLSGANAGAQALSSAIYALQAQVIDAALVVAYDSLIEPEVIIEMADRGALATTGLEDLRAPYDENANGVVPAESAAAILLKRTDEKGLATLSATNAADGAKAQPRPETIARLAAQLYQSDTIIDGCGFARPNIDRAERAALAELLPDCRLTALSAAMGALGATTAVVQSIVLAQALRTGRLYPIAGLVQPAKGSLTLAVDSETIMARSALAVSGGAPGLAGAVRVSL